MRYFYFVHFTFMKGKTQGSGNTEITTDLAITSFEHINDIMNGIRDKDGLDSVIVTNFILLRTEPSAGVL